ncbi:DUF4435 domain-containing protein [Pseudomonas alliivorans]|uniref:DUF4435 domain-containing protein n=1 Tax=Pseudomonas viridiflava TaxID=33069 RepID=UPI000F01E0DE|nr:DUF4435 domain-containing protein [Pseudomonas viridiflava]MEE4889724.1 DUF4435 domain-containing protein [Pseudomonas alliivorans]
MKAKNRPLPTIDELLATLKNSHLPTVIVEGSDDLLVYLRLEDLLYEDNVSVLSAGGRKNVLSIFERVHELPKTKKVIFIADKDTWVMTGVPSNYLSNTLLFTNGYSIENDAFQDCDLPKFMSAEEKHKFLGELERFLYWYALAVERHIAHGDESIKNHPNHILDNAIVFEGLTQLRNQEEFPAESLDTLRSDYKKLVRGKSLVQLAIRQLSYKGRRTRYSESNFLEYAAVNPGPLIGEIFKKVEDAVRR